MRIHYDVLDVMRFVAATSVLLFHLSHWLGIQWLLPNAGIAVDFFFSLSGFVMAIAYQEKIGSSLNLFAFVRLRALRLWPMIMLGTAISASYLLAKSVISTEAPPASMILQSASLSMIFLPYLDAPASLGGPQAFPLNGPQYSLFFEMFVNVVWAVILVSVPRKAYLPVCTALVIISAYCLSYGFGGDMTENFLLGFPRVTCAFFLGVIAANLFLSGYTHPLLGWTLFVALLIPTMLLLLLPIPLTSYASVWTVIVSPILALLGARLHLPTRLKGAASLSGALSYPIYALHYPLFCWLNGIFVMLMQSQGGLAEALLLYPAIMLLCYLATILIEQPVMSALRRKPMPVVGGLPENS